jgi:predicted deacetylase
LQEAILHMRTRTEIRMSCAKVSIRDQQSDFSYWQTQPYQVRLATLEEIRREFHQWRYGAEPGFQRVYTIVKQ